MGTCNGARYLGAQLDTIAAQSHRDWRLVVSDDGSTDATREILAAFRAAVGPERAEIREGPRRGFAANFLGLAGDPTIRADFYAFADQDDLWRPDRLARGLARLRAVPDRPALYGSRTVLIDEAGRETGRSRKISRTGARTPCTFPRSRFRRTSTSRTLSSVRSATAILSCLPIHPMAAGRSCAPRGRT